MKEILEEPLKRPRILMLSFDCNPYTGSEAATGWGMVMAISKIADLVVMVSSLDMNSIKKWLAENQNERIRFVEVPFPMTKSTVLRRLNSIYRRTYFVVYLEWLRVAKRIALRLEAEEPFDAAIHASLGCYWLPSPLRHLKTHVIWGPVGGATHTPLRLWPYLGLLGLFVEFKKILIIKLASCFPATRNTWRQVSIRIAENNDSLNAFPALMRRDTRVISRGPLISIPSIKPYPRKPYLLFPSMLHGRKGPRLAIKSLTYTPPSVRRRHQSHH